jgi:hypothetical protein
VNAGKFIRHDDGKYPEKINEPAILDQITLFAHLSKQTGLSSLGPWLRVQPRKSLALY